MRVTHKQVRDARIGRQARVEGTEASQYGITPLTVERLRQIAEATRAVAQFGTREQIIAAGFLPETADAMIAVRKTLSKCGQRD